MIGLLNVWSLEGQEEAVKSAGIDGVPNEVKSLFHVHEGNDDQQSSGDSVVGLPKSASNSIGMPDSVGPNVPDEGVGPFCFGLDGASGLSVSRAQRKFSKGSKQRKSKAQGGGSRSPMDVRPSKRSRREWEEQEEGFRFVGFTDGDPGGAGGGIWCGC
ncbi:hypothetical protein Hanom_Chr09g00769461 [Helianthus anomalus]